MSVSVNASAYSDHASLAGTACRTLQTLRWQPGEYLSLPPEVSSKLLPHSLRSQLAGSGRTAPGEARLHRLTITLGHGVCGPQDLAASADAATWELSSTMRGKVDGLRASTLATGELQLELSGVALSAALCTAVKGRRRLDADSVQAVVRLRACASRAALAGRHP